MIYISENGSSNYTVDAGLCIRWDVFKWAKLI